MSSNSVRCTFKLRSFELDLPPPRDRDNNGWGSE